MPVNFDNVIVGVTFAVVAALLGLLFMLLGALLAPKIVNRLTPNIDEEKEIVRGNVAVARYFGSIMHAVILGMSIIIAAAIIAGLHG